MIRIRVEVWKHGDPMDKELLGEAVVVNNMSGTPAHGNYTYTLQSKGKKFRQGEVKGFQRQRKNVWWLIYLVMRDAIWEQGGKGL